MFAAEVRLAPSETAQDHHTWRHGVKHARARHDPALVQHRHHERLHEHQHVAVAWARVQTSNNAVLYRAELSISGSACRAKESGRSDCEKHGTHQIDELWRFWKQARSAVEMGQEVGGEVAYFSPAR